MNSEYTCLMRETWSDAVLAEPGRRFSRFEAWLYITNVLAAPEDDDSSGCRRGEFAASIRQLAECFGWSRGSVERFLETLRQNSKIMRAGRDARYFIVCDYEIYSSRRDTRRDTAEERQQDLGQPNACDIETCSKPQDTGRENEPAGVCINTNNIFINNKSIQDKETSKALVEIYNRHNLSLPVVKAVTPERLRKSRSRIHQAVRDGNLEQYLADFAAAVKKAQETPFLRGEGSRGWRANFDWFVGNHLNVYAVLEGKYDSAFAKATADKTSRGYPIYVPRQ